MVWISSSRRHRALTMIGSEVMSRGRGLVRLGGVGRGRGRRGGWAVVGQVSHGLVVLVLRHPLGESVGRHVGAGNVDEGAILGLDPLLEDEVSSEEVLGAGGAPQAHVQRSEIQPIEVTEIHSRLTSRRTSTRAVLPKPDTSPTVLGWYARFR